MKMLNNCLETVENFSDISKYKINFFRYSDLLSQQKKLTQISETGQNTLCFLIFFVPLKHLGQIGNQPLHVRRVFYLRNLKNHSSIQVTKFIMSKKLLRSRNLLKKELERHKKGSCRISGGLDNMSKLENNWKHAKR